ncbi:MAG: phosphotransferase [Alphaproteobacteria bacterium]|nr:phosphotransferase [Alphaproteobacteria bacterium]
MNNFLKRYGYDVVKTLVEDGSSRRFYRVQKATHSAICMDCSSGEVPGHRLDDFVRIGSWLNSIGLKTPEIYELDDVGGFALLEDFGDISFKKAIEQGVCKNNLYRLANDVLEHFNVQDCPLKLPNYYDTHVYKAHRRVIDWYVPAVRKERNPDGLIDGYLKAWQEIEKNLPQCKQGFLHIDFHVENLMWLPEEKGLCQCGILDFQGAMIGACSYDLGNLLEDMRVDVSEDICAELLSGKSEDYLLWYRVLTTQFHCRLIGQIIRWAVRDGKSGYLQYLPRVSMYLQNALKEPVLEPLKCFFLKESIDFKALTDLNINQIAEYIHCDAV